MTHDDFKPARIIHFIYAAQPPGRRVYAIRTSYWETDALAAVGQVTAFECSGEQRGASQTAVNTNDTLSCIWCSSEGNLWVGSARGQVWTTADLQWQEPEVPELKWTQNDQDFVWRATEAVRSRQGHRYNITALWGSSDANVFAGTFEGDILRWDGRAWTRCYEADTRSDRVSEYCGIQRLSGCSATDGWAVGRNGTVLCWNGVKWNTINLPGQMYDGENLTGVWTLPSGETYICSTSGKIFHGTAAGLELLGSYDYPFYGIVEYRGDFILAAGSGGVCGLKGNQLTQLKSNLRTTGVYRLAEWAAFVEPEQPKPRIILFDGPNAKWFAWASA